MTELPAFRADGAINVVVESPRGSSLKFKYDATHGVMTLLRPLPVGLTYPFDWGFVPSTRAADGDPLDAVILWDGASYPGIVIPCRAIGVLAVEQTNTTSHKRERNDRVAMLPVDAPRHADVESVFDLTKRVREELEEFFRHAVAFEGKAIQFLGWSGPEVALNEIRQHTRTASPPKRRR